MPFFFSILFFSPLLFILKPWSSYRKRFNQFGVFAVTFLGRLKIFQLNSEIMFFVCVCMCIKYFREFIFPIWSYPSRLLGFRRPSNPIFVLYFAGLRILFIRDFENPYTDKKSCRPGEAKTKTVFFRYKIKSFLFVFVDFYLFFASTLLRFSLSSRYTYKCLLILGSSFAKCACRRQG